MTSDENGSAALLLIGGIAVTLLCFGALGLVVTTAERSHLQNQADQLALSAADIASGRTPGTPCDAVAAVALREHLRLESCQLSGLDARVVISEKVGPIGIQVRAHAGAPKSSPNLTSR